MPTKISAFALARFLLGLMFGRRIGWEAQQRSRARLGWDEAAAVFWPQTLFGLALTGWIGAFAPALLAFASPILVPLVFAIPIAALTTHPDLGRWSRSVGLFDIPEDRGVAMKQGAPVPAPAADAI